MLILFVTLFLLTKQIIHNYETKAFESLHDYVDENKLWKITDISEIEALCDQAIEDCKRATYTKVKSIKILCTSVYRHY